jgi:PAS domain S-box-containing protein
MSQDQKTGENLLQETVRQQKQRIHQLELNERLLNSLLEAISVGVMVLISPDGSIQYVKAKTEELFGYERNELIGAASEMLFAEIHRQLHEEHLSRRFDAQSSSQRNLVMELHGRRKDGSEFPMGGPAQLHAGRQPRFGPRRHH